MFGAGRLGPQNRVSIISRYDYFDSDTNKGDNDVKKLFIAGVAYAMYKGNTWLLDFQRLSHTVMHVPTEYQLQATLQVAF